MTLKFEQIIAADDLYEAMQQDNTLNADEEQSLADLLNEHYDALDQHPDKESFANKLVLQWPNSEINDLNAAMQGFAAYKNQEDTLGHMLSIRFDVRKRIMGLSDKRNLKPYELVLGEELNVDAYNACKDFSSNFIIEKCDVDAIAQHLAATTPSSQRCKVASNLSIIAPYSTLAIAVGAAFEAIKEKEKEMARVSGLSMFHGEPNSQASTSDNAYSFCPR